MLAGVVDRFGEVHAKDVPIPTIGEINRAYELIKSGDAIKVILEM